MLDYNPKLSSTIFKKRWSIVHNHADKILRLAIPSGTTRTQEAKDICGDPNSRRHALDMRTTTKSGYAHTSRCCQVVHVGMFACVRAHVSMRLLVRSYPCGAPACCVCVTCTQKYHKDHLRLRGKFWAHRCPSGSMTTWAFLQEPDASLKDHRKRRKSKDEIDMRSTTSLTRKPGS